MKVEVLERVEALVRLHHFLGGDMGEVFARNGGQEYYATARHLLDTLQFYPLLRLKRAEREVLLAFEELDSDTEYLRSELEQQLRQFQVLFQKMEKEDHLRRDRTVLSALDPTEPPQGILEWNTCSPTSPHSQ